MSALVRGFFLMLLRVFYPRISLRGDALPTGPLVVVANHPNGLLDPLIVRIALGRSVAFLAKSTLFQIPILNRWVRAFEAVPVYRAHEAVTAQNEKTFAACRALLSQGGTLALFPEGTSHDAPHLARLKTGAARIVLGAALDVRVVPIGLCYEAKSTFRSRVSATVGKPLDPTPFREQMATDERAAVQALTNAVHDALAEVVLEAEDDELWKGFVAVATWIADNPEEDIGARDERARTLAAAWRSLSVKDPDKVATITEEARRFARLLARIGIDNPLTLAAPARGWLGVARSLTALLVLSPFALVGALTSWLPYRAIGPIAERAAGGQLDVISTYKLLLGLLFFPLAWGVESGLVAWRAGWLFGVTLFVVSPLCGLVTLRWSEQLRALVELLRAGWLAGSHTSLVVTIEARRRALARRIADALSDVVT